MTCAAGEHVHSDEVARRPEPAPWAEQIESAKSFVAHLRERRRLATR